MLHSNCGIWKLDREKLLLETRFGKQLLQQPAAEQQSSRAAEQQSAAAALTSGKILGPAAESQTAQIDSKFWASPAPPGPGPAAPAPGQARNRANG